MDEYAQPVGEDKKPKRLRQKDIQAILEKRQEDSDSSISIWYRPAFGQALNPLGRNVPRSAAMVFSEVWKKHLERSPDNFTLVLETADTKPFERILDWIDLCIDEGNDVKFPDIDENENQLHVLLEVIATANFLKIPEGSLQAGLKKRAPGYARKHIIDLDLVERIYDHNDDQYPNDLQEIAAISIFEAWWTRKLDEPEYDEYTSFLEQMRIEYPKLDADLHDQFQKKKDFIEGKREEKKRLHDAEASGARAGADEGWDSADVQPTAVTAGGGWDSQQVDGAAEVVGNDWNDTGATTSAKVTIDNGWGGASTW